MQWEATDQFGNLYVGASQSTDALGLTEELRSMLTEIRERGAESAILTCDFEYCEISGPDPEQVSHILQVPWFAECEHDETIALVRHQALALLDEIGLVGVEVDGA